MRFFSMHIFRWLLWKLIKKVEWNIFFFLLYLLSNFSYYTTVPIFARIMRHGDFKPRSHAVCVCCHVMSHLNTILIWFWSVQRFLIPFGIHILNLLWYLKISKLLILCHRNSFEYYPISFFSDELLLEIGFSTLKNVELMKNYDVARKWVKVSELSEFHVD